MSPPTPTSPPEATPTPTLLSGVLAGLVAGVAISGVAVVAALIVMYLFLREDAPKDHHPCSPQQQNWQSHRQPSSPPLPSPPIRISRGSFVLNDSGSENSLSNFSYEKSPNGFGYVHKGAITNSQRLPVHEFFPNNKLEFQLKQPFSCNSNIIHSEIEAPNLLLDHKFESKVADFKLAKLYSNVNTHVSTPVLATSGCLTTDYRTGFQSHYIAWASKTQAQNLRRGLFRRQSPNFNLRKQSNYPVFSSAATFSTATATSAGASSLKPLRNFPTLKSPPPLPELLRKNLPEIFFRHNLHHLLRLRRKTYPEILRRHNSHHLRRSSSISSIQLRKNHYVNPNRNPAAMARALRFVRVLAPFRFLRL